MFRDPCGDRIPDHEKRQQADEPGAVPAVFYAMLFRQYKINYLDSTGTSLSQDVAEYRSDSSGGF